MISSCGHDENGRYRGGKAGDQTGTEYYLRTFYRPSYGWDCVLRHPDIRVGKKIAEIATQAAKNSKIGYDQNERLTYYNQLKVSGWHPERITSVCESDCSASTAAAVIATGHQLGLTRLQQVSPSNTTWTLKQALIAAGFECMTESKYLTSDAYLIPGDIVLAEAHHVVINVSTGSKVTTANGNGKGDAMRQYAGIVKVSSYLNVRLGPGARFGTVKLGGQEMRLPSNMVVSIDKETEGWGRLTGTGYWISLQYLQK